jgi:hypothetical protein
MQDEFSNALLRKRVQVAYELLAKKLKDRQLGDRCFRTESEKTVVCLCIVHRIANK